MQEYQQMAHFTEMSEEMMKFFMDLLINLTGDSSAIHTKDDAEDILKHLKKGKKVSNIAVNEEDKGWFADMLKKNGVSFVTFDTIDPATHKPKTVFVYKDTDHAKIASIVNDYKRHLDGKAHELDEKTFMDANREKGFYKVGGLSLAELQVFREVAPVYDMDFVVLADEKDKNKFMICANDKWKLNECVTDMVFRTSGPDGREYLKEMEEYLKSQSKTYENLEKVASAATVHNPMYIIDAKNPSKIIMIADGKYSLHKLKVDSEKLPSGKISRVADDYYHESYDKFDKGIMDKLADFEHPVMMPAENFVDGINKDGSLLINQDFVDANYLRNFSNQLLKSKPITMNKPIHKSDDLLYPGTLRTFTDLPLSVTKEIEKANLDGVYVYKKDVAYRPEMEDAIQEILEKHLYVEATPIQKMEAELRYRGRGEGKLKNLSPEETYYVIDASSPREHVLTVNMEGCLFQNGKHDEMIHKPANAPDYEVFVLRNIETMAIPIVLTEKEYLNRDIYKKALQDRVFGYKDNRAVQMAVDANINERVGLSAYTVTEYSVGSVKDLQDKDFTSRQKETIDRKSNLQVQEVSPLEMYINDSYDNRELEEMVEKGRVKETQRVRTTTTRESKHKREKEEKEEEFTR